jgi:hypothetical protein
MTTDGQRPLIPRGRRKVPRIVAKKETAFACKFVHARSSRQCFTRLEVHMTWRKRLGVLATLASVGAHLVAAWLAKH